MGVLKVQSTLTIAVWSSILLHTAGFLGFELAFSNKSKPFPKSVPRTVTLLSIGGAQDTIAPLEKESLSNNIPAQIIENFIPDELVPIKNEPSSVQSEDRSFSDFLSGNAESNNSDSNSDQSLNQKVSIVDDIGKMIPEIREPVPVETITPVYPFRARKKSFEGVVTLDVTVSDKGIPDSCQIINSSGYKELDDAAVKTVLASLFYPGTVDGEDIQSILRILIKFQLDDS